MTEEEKRAAHFLDEFTGKIMRNPMRTRSGHYYDRTTVDQAIGTGVDPIDYSPFTVDDAIPLPELQQQIHGLISLCFFLLHLLHLAYLSAHPERSLR
jgi:hypothetical protein